MERINTSTYFGYIQNTKDALLVFEAVRQNRLPKITRRLREEERLALIRSGAVFVFDEVESGVKRWTDGLYWSPSRILNNFLVYRQMEKKASQNSEDSKSKNKEHIRFSASDGAPQVPEGPLPPSGSDMSLSSRGPSQGALPGPVPGVDPPGSELTGSKEGEVERSLVGSLTSSFPFIHNGLCKKTISFPIGNSHQHLISYYAIEDVLRGRLRTPSSLPELNSLTISPQLLNRSNFRIPPQIELDHEGVPQYRGEPIETPQNTRRRSGPPGSGDEQPSNVLGPDGRTMIGSSSSSGMGRMGNTPYSPVSATGMTGPAEDFRGHQQQHQHQHQQNQYAHHPQPPFQFSSFDPAVATSGAMLSGGGGNHNNSSEHFGNRRRVVSDAPSRLGQLRIGAARYEPYPSSSSSSSFHSESGHSSAMGMSGGHSGSTDSHLNSPIARRDPGGIMTTPGGANGNGGTPDGRPQSARLYGEHHQNGIATGLGWRGDAGYVPVTPGTGSVNSSTAQSPRGENNFAPPSLPPIGSGPLNPTTVASHDYSQHSRGSHELSPYYPHMMQQANNAQSPARMVGRQGPDWHVDGMFTTGPKGSGLGGASGGADGNSGDANSASGHSNMTVQGMPVHPGSSAEHVKMQSGGEGSAYVYVSGGGEYQRAGGGGGAGYDYSHGPGTTNISTSDRNLSADLAGGRSDPTTAISPNAPYYPSVASWSSTASSEIGADALQVMQGQLPLPPNSSLSSASSSQGNNGHHFRAPGPTPDWRAAQEAHHAHRSNSMGSEFSATGPGSGSGAHHMDWTRPDPSLYGQSGGMTSGLHGPGAGSMGRSPLATTIRDGASGGGLERVVLRRPPSNG